MHSTQIDCMKSFDGVEISFTDQGEGPATILLHAFMIDSGLNWHETGIADALERMGRRVICPDLRGHGESDMPREASAYHHRAMASDVRALITHLELTEVDLVGYSMGSCVAIQVALRDPRVRSLILAGTGIGEASPWDPENRKAEIDALRSEDPDEECFYRQLAEEVGADPWVVAARLEGEEFPQFTTEQISKLHLPVTVINGCDDFEDPQLLAASFPSAKAIQCEGDHLSTIWEPSFVDALAESLAD